MAELESKKSIAAQRSHEDAKAANALFQAAGQAAILINGGASTAILAFAAADKAVIRITASALACSLVWFAVGVVAGAFVIAFQAASVQRYVIHWEGTALGYADNVTKRANARGRVWGFATQIAFVISVLCFLAGAIGLAASLGNFKSSA